MRALRAHPARRRPRPAATRDCRAGCSTKDKLIHLAPDLLVADLAAAAGDAGRDRAGRRRAAAHRAPAPLASNNSWMHNSARLTRGKPRHHLLMHPDDLASRGLADGAHVTVASRVGTVTTEVRATDDMMRGVVSLPHGYGHQVEGVRLGNAETVAGVSINDLTDPDLLDVSGNAALSGVPVTVCAAPA